MRIKEFWTFLIVCVWGTVHKICDVRVKESLKDVPINWENHTSSISKPLRRNCWRNKSRSQMEKTKKPEDNELEINMQPNINLQQTICSCMSKRVKFTASLYLMISKSKSRTCIKIKIYDICHNLSMSQVASQTSVYLIYRINCAFCFKCRK